MLRGTVAFLVLVTCAVIGAEIRFALARRGVRAPGMEGLSFLAVGFVLGGRVLGLFPEDLVDALRVVVLFGLAWIGLAFGLQVELRIMRRLASWHRRLGFAAPTVVGLAVAVTGLASGLSAALALGLGAVAMASSPSALESLTRGRRVLDRSSIRLLKLYMAFAGIPAVALFAVATALASPLGQFRGGSLAAHELLVFTAAIGVLVGYAGVVLVRGVTDQMQILTLVLGCMCLVAGATSVLGLNAVPAAVCAGAVLINRCVFPNRMLRVAHSLERPMLVALLVLIGASWSTAEFSLGVFVLLTVVRAAVATAVGAVVYRIARSRGERPRSVVLGLGLLPQGELALALTVAMVSFFAESGGVLEAVVAAILVNNIVGGWWMRRRLIHPQPAVKP